MSIPKDVQGDSQASPRLEVGSSSFQRVGKSPQGPVLSHSDALRLSMSFSQAIRSSFLQKGHGTATHRAQPRRRSAGKPRHHVGVVLPILLPVTDLILLSKPHKQEEGY